MITLTKKQQEVVDRLQKLPGADSVSVKAEESYWRPDGRPQRTLTITGGWHRDGVKLPCGHYDNHDTHDRAAFHWLNGRYQPSGGYRNQDAIERKLQRLERGAAPT